MKPINNIIIFRLSSIGDIILTTALIRCLKNSFPESSVTYIVKKEFYDLVKYNPYINKVYSFDKKDGFKGLIQLKRKIKNDKYDWFIDIHNNIRSNIIKRGLNIKYKTRYHKKIFKRTLLIKTKLNLYKNNEPVLLRYFQAVEKFNVKYDSKGTDVFFKQEEKNFIQTKLKEINFDIKKIAVICPGASYSNKQWKINGFIEIAKYLINKNYNVVLLGGKSDTEICRIINESCKHNCLDISGKLKLLESAVLLSYSKITITNDSGMMHMAQSQNSSVVAIFGPTTTELGYFPIPQHSRVVEKELNCRPCTHKGLNYCPKKHFKCMNDISAPMVIKEIETLLQ